MYDCHSERSEESAAGSVRGRGASAQRLRHHIDTLRAPASRSHDMQMAMIGLGRMGGNMVERLMRNGHQTVVYDRSADVVAKYQKLGATPAHDLAEVVTKLKTPRVVWIMVPAGAPVDDTIQALVPGYGEGYEILHASKDFPRLDLRQIAEVWQHGSVVRSWLNELAVRAFSRDVSLSDLKGYVADSGEGRWTVQEAIDSDTPAPV